jgi:methylmalonyl-CoA decarboxylase
MPLVLVDIEGPIGTLTFNNEARRNALGKDLIAEAIEGFDACARREVRVAILRAKPGARVWSAGHDITELPRKGRDPLTYNDPLERLIRAVREFKAPVIALIEGSVWGGACELAICCDIPVGAPNATFAITPARIGVPYNPAGILRLMNEVDTSVVKEMFFTASPIPARRALEVGLLNHLVPFEEIEAFTKKLATSIAELAPLSIAVIKEQIRLLANAHPLAPETFERIQGRRRDVYDSEDYEEGIAAFLEKRRPCWRGR